MEEVYYEYEKQYNKPIFSESITHNKWVLYHGTSSFFEEDILRNGLKRHSISKSLVEKFVEIYDRSGLEEIDWKFTDFHAASHKFQHLKSYTLKVDFSGENTIKPIFFSEEISYAFTYTQSEFLGGETISAINKCLTALEKYCGNDDFRNAINKELWRKLDKIYIKHGWELALPASLRRRNYQNGTEMEFMAIYDYLAKNYFNGKKLPNIRRSFYQHQELRDALNKLMPLIKPYILAKVSHSSGIIIAVEFEQSDLSNFRDMKKHKQNQGYAYENEIGPEKIIGICRIPEGTKYSKESDIYTLIRRREDSEDILYHLDQK